MSYNLTDRLKEWTSFAGVAVAAVAVVVPQMIPATDWVHYWSDAQLVLGAALLFIPHSASTTAVENDAMSLLQAITAKVPPEYAAAVQPLIAKLAQVTTQAPLPTPPAQIVPAVRVAAPAAGPVVIEQGPAETAAAKANPSPVGVKAPWAPPANPPP